ncbi:hypothetical protein Barb4_04093 [Bacteroidales bacterium Barb4]|nr:hypothetical protein Barb4_04093 [Bacteroidales bacterium Barb4]
MIGVFCKLRLNGRVPCQDKGKESVGGKAVAPCICPFQQMITVVRGGFHAYRISIIIYICAVHCRCAAVVVGGQGYIMGGFRKTRHKGRVPCQVKDKSIFGRGDPPCTFPFQKRIPRGRNSH